MFVDFSARFLNKTKEYGQNNFSGSPLGSEGFGHGENVIEKPLRDDVVETARNRCRNGQTFRGNAPFPKTCFGKHTSRGEPVSREASSGEHTRTQF